MSVLQNFIVFEGGDGSGTSTQLELLKRRFGKEDALSPPVIFTFEPTDGAVGRLLRAALRGEPRLHGETMTRLFSADRAEHLYGEGGIVEAAERGSLVICDRYTLSSRVYQGLECGDGLPAALNGGFPAPELLLFFDIDPRLALLRLETRTQKDVYESLDFQLRVRERYLGLLDSCRAEGSRVVVIDASAPIDAVAEAVWQNISLLPVMPRQRGSCIASSMKKAIN
ncbi:MAG: dTMP kinase [Spirochaetaceae bacterium]|jgi:dTMP kinase|nr:dTMP kinase [Spirochaetaceae bacterium]